MNLNHLRAFYTVAKYKSFSKASEHLYVQQPALSKTVKALEESLGLQLFQKSGRGVELTSEAQYVYAKCEEIFSQVDQIVGFSQDLGLPMRDTVGVVSNDAVATQLLPSVFQELSLKFPTTRPVVTTGTAEEMLEQLLQRKASVGFFFHAPKLPAGVKLYKSLDIRFYLVIRSQSYESLKVRSTFIGSREVDSQKVKKFPTVEKMREHWPQTQIRYSLNSLVAHKAMVLQGLGVSILPEFLVRQELNSGELKILLKDQDFHFKLRLIVPTRYQLGELEKLLIQKVEEEVAG